MFNIEVRTNFQYWIKIRYPSSSGLKECRKDLVSQKGVFQLQVRSNWKLCTSNPPEYILFSASLTPVWDGRRFGTKGGKGYDSLISVRNLEEHARLRKPWNRAFATTPVKGYEVFLVKRVKKLVQGLEKACRSSADGVGRVDLAEWSNYLTFDFMGDLAFGSSFNTLEEGDAEGYVQAVHNALVLPSITQHVPWILPLLKRMPVVSAERAKFMAFGQAQVKRRLGLTTAHPDLFHHMIEAAEERDSGTDPEALVFQNSLLTIVAGSDTTASALSNVFYYLMRYPIYYARLRTEIDEALGGSESVEVDQLTNLSFLNAVMNETLRLQPAVPTYLSRAPLKGSGGKMLGKSLWIPENTSVVVSPYAMHRDPRYFSPRPDDFWPERWLRSNHMKNSDSSEPFILARDAFIPFSVGPANCAGKPVALMELRLAIANVIRRFDMAFDDGYDSSQWERELLDHFAMVKGQLRSALRVRRL